MALSAQEAASCAERLGFPVVLKLNSTTVTHKTDVGGVVLNLHTAYAVRQAFEEMRENVERLAPKGFEGVTVQPMVKMKGYEVILGSSLDPQLGPVLLFGTGGALVEVFQDSAVALPPLNANLARKMLQDAALAAFFRCERGPKALKIRSNHV